jgi:hypothetical protein
MPWPCSQLRAQFSQNNQWIVVELKVILMRLKSSLARWVGWKVLVTDRDSANQRIAKVWGHWLYIHNPQSSISFLSIVSPFNIFNCQKQPSFPVLFWGFCRSALGWGQFDDPLGGLRGLRPGSPFAAVPQPAEAAADAQQDCDHVTWMGSMGQGEVMDPGWENVLTVVPVKTINWSMFFKFCGLDFWEAYRISQMNAPRTCTMMHNVWVVCLNSIK